MHTSIRRAVILLVVLAAACSPSTDDVADQMHADMLEAGLSSSTVDCVDGIMREGETAEQFLRIGLGGEPGDDFLERTEEFMACIPPEEFPALISMSDPEDMRNGFVAGFVASAGGVADEDQANCVYDHILASDLGVEVFLADSMRAAETGVLSGESEALLGDALAACGLF